MTPTQEVWVGVKGQHSCSPHVAAQSHPGCPHSCLSNDHCKEGLVSTAAEDGNQFQDWTEVFSQGDLRDTIISGSGCKSGLLLLYIF